MSLREQPLKMILQVLAHGNPEMIGRPTMQNIHQLLM